MLFKKCSGCNKKKFLVRNRAFYVKRINETITSQGKLCSKCSRAIKKIINKMQ